MSATDQDSNDNLVKRGATQHANANSAESEEELRMHGC